MEHYSSENGWVVWLKGPKRKTMQTKVHTVKIKVHVSIRRKQISPSLGLWDWAIDVSMARQAGQQMGRYRTTIEQ